MECSDNVTESWTNICIWRRNIPEGFACCVIWSDKLHRLRDCHVCLCVCVCVRSERSYFTSTVTSLTLFGNAKAVTDTFSITDHIRSGVTSCLFPCWTRNRSFSPLKSPYLNWPGIWFWPFPSFPSHFLYRAPPFSRVRSPTIASSTPNPHPHPPKFYFRNLSNWITYICKGKKTRKGSCLCLCAWEGSCIGFDPIRCIFCVCLHIIRSALRLFSKSQMWMRTFAPTL